MSKQTLFCKQTAAGLALLLLTGCAAVGPEFKRPEAQTASQWQESRDPAISEQTTDDSDWWKVFNDRVLDKLIDIAYQQNLTLRIAGARILESRAQLGIAVGTFYPQEQSVNGGVVYQSASESGANTRIGDLSFTDSQVSFDAAWELDFWGKFRRGIESADANFLASIADYDDVLVTLTADVAATYVAIRTLSARLRIARDNTQIQQRSVEIADVRFRGGFTTELDVQQAKALLYNTQATIPQLETSLRQAKNAMSILLGLPPGQIDQLLDGPDTIPDAPAEVAVGIPNELLRRRPDVRRAELQAAAQSALIGVAKADLYPSFALFGSVGVLASSGTDTTKSGQSGNLFSSDSVFFVGGPTFNWPIFNYGRIKNNVRVQDARLQQALANYQNTVLRAAREAEDSMIAFLRARQEISFRIQSEQAAKRSVDLALIQYREGTTNYNTVLTTQQSLVGQQDQLTTTRGDIVLNLVSLYKALGGGWQIRQGKPFVPESVQKEMSERTDWGGIISPKEPPPGEKIGTKRSPDW